MYADNLDFKFEALFLWIKLVLAALSNIFCTEGYLSLIHI